MADFVPATPIPQSPAPGGAVDLNLAVVIGELSSAARVTELPSGDRLFHYEVRARLDDATTSVPVVWLDPPARTRILEAGARVVAVGRIHRRFHRAGSTTVSRTELRATKVVPATRRAEVDRLVQGALDGLITASGRAA